MRLIAATVLAALAGAAPAAAWHPDVRAARAYADSRAGQERFVVRQEHRRWGVRPDEPVNSVSIVKAMFMVAYLNQPEVRARPLRRADKRLVGPMVRWSDNDAASTVLGIVGPEAVERVAHRVPMHDFALDTHIWGASTITAADQARFFLHVERYVVKRHRRYALRLLRTIVPKQRWGVGAVAPDGWELYFKGGWGKGSGAADHQVALLRRGRSRISIAVLTTANPSHRYGKETLRGVFARLLRGL